MSKHSKANPARHPRRFTLTKEQEAAYYDTLARQLRERGFDHLAAQTEYYARGLRGQRNWGMISNEKRNVAALNVVHEDMMKHRPKGWADGPDEDCIKGGK